jgi:AcrR family transcriptional regulator
MTGTASAPHRHLLALRGRARTQRVLFKAAARAITRSGYEHTVMEHVAREAGISLRALYHLFADKEELALAVVEWAEQAWYDEVGYLFDDVADPVGALLAVARGHAVYWRQDVPPILTTLRAEFQGRDHPVGRAIDDVQGRFMKDTVRLINAGRRSGAIPPGPPSRELALAYLGALAWAVKNLSVQPPFDALLLERVVSGLLGVAPTMCSTSTTTGTRQAWRNPKRRRRPVAGRSLVGIRLSRRAGHGGADDDGEHAEVAIGPDGR